MSHNYKLEVIVRDSPLPVEDHDGDITTSGTLTLDTEAEGVHASGTSSEINAAGRPVTVDRPDHDWFEVDLVFNRRYVIDLDHSAHVGNRPGYATTMVLHDNEGRFVTTGDYDQAITASKTLNYTAD